MIVPGAVDQPGQVLNLPDRFVDSLLKILAPAFKQYDKFRSRQAVIAGWILTRGIIVLALLLSQMERDGAYDITYYGTRIRLMAEAGLANTMREYPTPVTWILWIPHALTGGVNQLAYTIAFVGLMMACDAIFTYSLWRAAGRRHDASIDFWLLFVLLSGPIVYTRFDIIPCVLAGGALLAMRNRP